jgi:ubiquinone/menaquinone biosynthesis C-methylase UbiE
MRFAKNAADGALPSGFRNVERITDSTKRGSVMGNVKKVYLSRNRNLGDFDAKFGRGIIESKLRKALRSCEPVRLLEIGCGEGRVLMELRKLFPAVELHGINKKPWPAMKGPKSLIATAANYGIFTKEEARRVSLPALHFYDATELRFPGGYFDVVISQVSFYLMKRKDLLLEEVWRVLKKGGKAFLHVDSMYEDYPDFISQETPRFIIYKNKRLHPLRRFIKEMRVKGYDITCKMAFGNQAGDKDLKRTHIVMHKNTEACLELSLSFDELSSFDLSVLGKIFKGDKLVGHRSVFHMETPARQALTRPNPS